MSEVVHKRGSKLTGQYDYTLNRYDHLYFGPETENRIKSV